MGLSDEARLEADLLAIDLARGSYLDYAQYVYKGWINAAHHQLLAAYLEEVERYVATGGQQGIGRLLIFMPPRHGKSLNASVLFPTWFLGRNPDRRVIISSYNSSLATSFSRMGRNIMFDSPYQAVFGLNSVEAEPVTISDDSRSVESWNLAYPHKGGMVAAGVGGGITGKGAHLFIVDDPHKDRADAESQARREAVWNWWTSTAYTRLEDGAAVIGMLTRWHADDWAGRLLRSMVEDLEADQWTVLCLPALAEDWAHGVEGDQVLAALKAGWWMGVDPLERDPGEALWPGKYPAAVLHSIAANIGSYDFDALYQQRPWKAEGTIIRARQIKVIDEEAVPGDVRPVRYWDLAVGRSKKAHYIAGALLGMDKRKNIYIIDVARFPAPWSDARPKMVTRMLEDPVEVVQYIEVFGQQDGYYQELRDDDGLHLRAVRPFQPVGDKEAKAQLWATKIPDGKVFMVRGPWNEDFVAEAVAFPNGATDDQVDGVSGAYQACPGHVTMSDVQQAPDTPSRWSFLLEGREGMTQDEFDRSTQGRWEI